MSFPSNWKKLKFGDVAQQIVERIDDPQKSGYNSYIGLEHIESEQINIQKYGDAEEVKSSKFLCQKGDIIFGRRRAYLRKLAVCDRDSLVSTDAMVIRPKKEVIKEYLILMMQTDYFWEKAISLSAGSLSPRVKWRELSTIEFYIPPLDIQKKISEILWSIQDNLEKMEKLIQITEKLKKELLEELLTKGIGHNKFKKTELGEIPKEWDNKTIFDAAKNKEEAVQTGPFGAQLHSCDYVVKGIPLILIRNIENDEITSNNIPYINEEKVKQLEKYRIQPGDIVFSRVADVGRAAVATEEHRGWLISGQMLRVRLNNQKINNDFVKYLIKTQNFKDVLRMKTVGSTRDSINTTILGEMPIIIPPIDEQIEICGILNKFDLTLKKYDEHIKILFSLKKEIVNKFLSGELLIKKEVLN